MQSTWPLSVPSMAGRAALESRYQAGLIPQKVWTKLKHQESDCSGRSILPMRVISPIGCAVSEERMQV